MIRVLCLAATMAGFAVPVLAQSRVATGTVTIEPALTISAVRPLSFGGSPATSKGLVASIEDSEAVVQVTGDPGRFYRVRLPAAIVAGSSGTTIDSFTIWSDNSGDISETLSARLDSNGLDRLHVGGSLRHAEGVSVSDVSTTLPLIIDFE